jgi:hypothetical protein
MCSATLGGRTTHPPFPLPDLHHCIQAWQKQCQVSNVLYTFVKFCGNDLWTISVLTAVTMKTATLSRDMSCHVACQIGSFRMFYAVCVPHINFWSMCVFFTKFCVTVYATACHPSDIAYFSCSFYASKVTQINGKYTYQLKINLITTDRVVW